MANPNIRKGITKPSDENFHWVSDTSDFEVPSISKLDPDMDAMADFVGHEDELGPLMKLMRSCVGPEVGAALGKMRLSEFRDFAEAWNKHSGMSLGN